MPGDYSRKTFDRKKHYSGVLMQQGRVQLDADWNEEIAIEQYRTITQTKDVIGPSGVPKKNGGFKISSAPNGTDLIIAPGRIYVEGLLCELEPDPVASYRTQPYYPAPDQSVFNAPGSPPTSPASPPTSPPASPPAATSIKDGSYIVYLKAWQREINYLDDPSIQEKALGEADTATRLQTVWQVRLLSVADGSGNCKKQFPEWDALVAPRTGLLNAQTKKPVTPATPCELPPSAGYLRLENQLYRVQVQKVDAAKRAQSFKWSRDNASVETSIEEVTGKVLKVGDTGKDEVLAFGASQWVEIVDPSSALGGLPNPLIQIDTVNSDTREITLKTSVPQFEQRKGLKLRRWDTSGISATQDGLPVIAGWQEIEDGIQVMFSNGTFEPGDYWHIPARTATGNIEWPQTDPGGLPVAQARKGTQYFYTRLAFAKVLNGNISLEDCRKLFPSLTEICAEDICYDSKGCEGSQARTVQEALDDLCRRRGGSCTVHAVPGPGWEAVFNQIPDAKDAQICFPVGDYPLTNAASIKNKGHLKLNGSGAGTRIIAAKAEAALIFTNCSSVIIRDIYAETGLAGKGATARHLNGTLSFEDCKDVNIESVSLKCGVDTLRAATCITVRNGIQFQGSVRVQNARLSIGHGQQGILLVNVTQSLVENNTLDVYEHRRPNQILLDKKTRAGLLKLLVSNAFLGRTAPVKGTTNTRLQSGDFIIHIRTQDSLKKDWQQLVNTIPPNKITSEAALLSEVKKIANRLVADEPFRNRFVKINALITPLLLTGRPVASQGITIGGRVANDVRILNNSIGDTLQGIHVGLSHQEREDVNDLADTVTIAGNTIAVMLPADVGKQERNGIFVGNCKSLIVENNNIRLERLANADKFLIDGIRIWGVFGDRMMVTKNHVSSIDNIAKNSFDIGINVNPITARRSVGQWVVMWNVAPSKQTTVRAVNGAVSVPGTNVP